MSEVRMEQLVRLKAVLSQSDAVREALPACVGGKTLGNACWRLFSESHPKCGIDRWNQEWCAAWGIPRETAFMFGEDVFGNQLIVIASNKTVYVCDHENGSCYDLQLGVVDLLESVLKHGLSWIDFYSNGSLDVALGFVVGLTCEQQLHWTQPLILGGEIKPSNVSVVDRFAHLSGHIQLWKQVSALPPCTEIRIQ